VRYIILSLNDDRIGYKQRIRESLSDHAEVPMQAVDGRNRAEVKEAMDEFRDVWYGQDGFRLDRMEYSPREGEVGVWLSNLRAWKLIEESGEPCMVIEDDAIPKYHIKENLAKMEEYLPADFSFVPLYTPTGDVWLHSGTSFMGMEENPVLARSFQTYCHVAMYYSPDGARRLLDLAAKLGPAQPVDIFTMHMALSGLVNGYAFQRQEDLPFTYDWSAPTTIHDTERTEWQ
jgi:GR25 family glycosyltransferase involved in LPS biosynthesis